jgi:hypothetical protein
VSGDSPSGVVIVFIRGRAGRGYFSASMAAS